jgi:beta-galactosidase
MKALSPVAEFPWRANCGQDRGFSRRDRIAIFRGLVLAGIVALGPWGSAIADQPQKSGNIAAKAKVSASSSRPEFPIVGVNDGRMDSQWSTALGATTGQWLQMDWNEPQDICGVVLLATGPWTQSIDFQVRHGGTWVSVAQSGSANERTPEHAIVEFKPQRTRSLRLVFVGGAAYHEVEVYNDQAVVSYLAAEQFSRASIVVAGDLRGHLMGTVSLDEGKLAVSHADVKVSGKTPSGPWQETIKTGEQGDFEFPLPFAVNGPIDVSVAKADLKAKEVFDSRNISIQMTPRSAETLRERVSLCGTWEFAADPPKGFPANRSGLKWSPIQVPAHWEMEGFTAESGRAVYRKTFRVPTGWRDKRVKILAQAVYSHAQVWVNGRRAGGHEGGFTPFERDITEMVAPGAENEILVLVDARTMASDLDNASYFAYFELAGIWQPIEVFATSLTYVSHLAVTTDFDKDYQNAMLAVEIDAVNQQAASGSLAIHWRLLDPQGKEVPISAPATQVALASWQRKTLRYATAVKSPQSWNAEQPRVYRLVAEVTDGAGRRTTIEQPLGFRNVAVKGRVLTLNGRPVKFRGISRLDAHPLMGRALTPEVDRLDMELIKDANFNMVRATIAPPHPASLDACDALGLYVENEGPTCWGSHAADLRYAAVYQGLMCEYLERDRNHPSVVDWSICNESSYARVFSMTCRKMRSIDSTRTYTGTFGDDTLDMIVYHHPISLDRIRKSLADSKPAFFDEVLGLFHGMYDLGLFEDLDPGMRDYWIEGMPAIQRALDAGENQAGAVQFCWVDDAFLVPGKGIDITRRSIPELRYTESVYKLPKRGVIGEPAWGTLDGWRRPRPEYWLSKKLHSPVQIDEQPLALPATGEPIVVVVRNRNQFADLDQYICRWEAAGESGEARARAAPMSNGKLEISVRRPPKADSKLLLRFYDAHGRMIDAYRLSFRPRALPRFPNSGKAARIVEQSGYLDDSSAIRLLGPKVELAYDRTSGELFRALIDRETVMTLGPKLHLQKSTSATNEYPLGSARKIGMVYGPDDVPGDSVWKFTGADYRKEGNQAVLNWKGHYGKDFEGGFEVRMDDAGDVELRYQFKYAGKDVWVREIGLEFELPLSFNKLSWDRNAEYSYYPADHIGRPLGEAVAHPAVPQTVPPGDRPYGLDDHPWGSNDFRSTKRHIFTASLTNKAGQGVQVISDGSQHVRATVGVHEIKFKVLDFYGGTSYTYHEGYHYGPGRKIKTGEVLQGTVQLKLLGEPKSG